MRHKHDRTCWCKTNTLNTHFHITNTSLSSLLLNCFYVLWIKRSLHRKISTYISELFRRRISFVVFCLPTCLPIHLVNLITTCFISKVSVGADVHSPPAFCHLLQPPSVHTCLVSPAITVTENHGPTSIITPYLSVGLDDLTSAGQTGAF